ncbi:MAG: hypothetical protein AB1638_03975 [Nitrospirota bacterium]
MTFIVQGRLTFFDVSPNLTSVLAYYVGLRKGEVKSLFFGSFLGIVEDSLSAIVMGPNLLSKGLVGYSASFMSGSFFRWTPLLGIIGISVLTFMDSSVVLISRSIFDRMPISIGGAAFVTTIRCLVNAPFGIFLRPKDVY